MHYERSLGIYQALEDAPNVATLLHYLGGLAIMQADGSAALAYYERALTIWSKLRSVVGLNRAIVGLVHAARLVGDPQSLAPTLHLLASPESPQD
jgi:hypothetical protein